MLLFESQSIVPQSCDSSNYESNIPTKLHNFCAATAISRRSAKLITKIRYVPYDAILSTDPLILFDEKGPHLNLLVNPIERVMRWNNLTTKALTKRSYSSL